MELSGERSLSQFLEYCRKRTKEYIRRCKKKAKWYWPELHLYCGVCKLSTGLYIRSAFYLVIYVLATALNIFMVYCIVDRGRHLFHMDVSAIEDYFDVNLTDENYEHAKKIYTVIVAYLIMWSIFKILYILSLILTIYAMYKRKPKILKIVLFNNAINWILDIILSFFGAVLTQLFSKTLVVICILLEGYNLMALSSEYKQLKGKSKLVLNLTNADSNVEEAITSINNVCNETEVDTTPRHSILRHCETCTCHLEPILPTYFENTVEVGSTDAGSSVTTAQCTPVEEVKELNIKDVEIIFNQDQLLQQNSSVLETNDQRPERPRVLELPQYDLEKEKDIPDVAVIYDESQLQVGGSPVIESRESTVL